MYVLLLVNHFILGERDGLPFWGYTGVYGGDGYIANLGNTSSSSEYVTASLSTHNWLDEHTRAVFIEFSILNMNTGLFSMVTFLFEFPTSGGVFQWKEIQTIHLYRYTGAAGLFTVIVELLCCIFFIIVVVREVTAIISGKWKHFAKMSTWFQIIIIILIGYAFIMYIIRSSMTMSTIEKIMNNKGMCISYCNSGILSQKILHLNFRIIYIYL